MNFGLVNAVDDLNLIEGVLTVQVPLYLPKDYLKKQYKALLDEHHLGRRGVRTNQKSTARYPITGHVDVHALQKCLRTWDVKINNPNLKLWEVGQLSKLTKASDRIINSSNKKDPDIVAKKAVLASSASRMLKKAEIVIAGVAEGKFPELK